MNDSNERAVEGDNNPPVYDQEIVDTHKAKLEKFSQASIEWSKIDEVKDEAMAERLTDFVAGTRKFYGAVEKDRKAAKEPHFAAGKSVDLVFGKITGPTKTMGEKAKALLGKYMIKKAKIEAAEKAEQDRIARAEEDAALKKLAEAEKSGDVLAEQAAVERIETAQVQREEAAKPVSTKVASATGGGRTVSLRTTRSAEITNINLLFMHYKNHPDIFATLTRLANADIRAKDVDETKIQGINIIETKAAA